MSTFLFDSIIFGPVWSRRLGESLGVNLLPANRKVCNFNCIYCECGLTPNETPYSEFPSREEVKKLLAVRLQEMKKNGDYLNSITFAGNGEPTLHPDFAGIMSDTLAVRNTIFPEAKITVLSNATRAGISTIFDSLSHADLNILKLDSAIESTLLHINCPKGNFDFQGLIDSLKRFKGKLIIQTLFFRGKFMGHDIDNSTGEEISAWLKVIESIRPECVMVYSLARDTPLEGLERIGIEELTAIANRVEELNIAVQVTP
jgi:wyosine [tRNA(Phe)-imidazoG37] synthetase (radical SAM superfamily)